MRELSGRQHVHQLPALLRARDGGLGHIGTPAKIGLRQMAVQSPLAQIAQGNATGAGHQKPHFPGGAHTNTALHSKSLLPVYTAAPSGPFVTECTIHLYGTITL